MTAPTPPEQRLIADTVVMDAAFRVKVRDFIGASHEQFSDEDIDAVWEFYDRILEPWAVAQILEDRARPRRQSDGADDVR